ncbi:V-type H+-transporting ATPase subunit E [Nematocida parisii]|uniref:ATP synthase subunit n=1 Tax=Nematocida parisii (strain ERTm1 / ATCC PRA-289) TaxID=881290 RepID=UPI000264B40E|nr:ATP synthase subunit [Nematocida parisii ERTm1]KAI5131816.1 V-type H+-transporting ATPase subunit E [Nematocida parisii]EIJ94679.1 ATP synthase subunit [Nematocida parisii ERTm1]KAI5131829.1 V-type H+-transporting ATPase subunit E [Nematocida parisii]KAI5146264.1 V-type H+-transporting ATPase subunit E [Nematocida parisii]KAI5146439.1 V-type H+-transporting ATPase subunit E [Nematocida parisii]|eukprot:XP_013058035.1 ATP synthase subunit [Nematocida parisii ERTm1]
MTGKPLTKGLGGRKYAVDGWDMGRMLKFIQQEAEQKTQEIKIKANEDYRLRVSELAVTSTQKINKMREEEMHRIQMDKTIAVGKLRAKACLSIAKQKEHTINRILNTAAEKCKNSLLTEKLVKETVEKYRYIFPKKEMIIHIQEKNKSIVKNLLNGEDYRIEPLNEDMLGGIVIRDEERTVLVNNSYLERLRCAGDKVQPIIQKIIFTKLSNNK